jgi:hypothetical protein
MLPDAWKNISLRQIQHNEGAPLLMGCPGCRHFDKCSGLQLELGVYDCLEFCNCADPSRCDVVCSNVPERFVRRVREIDGFELTGLPLAPTPDWPVTSQYIPVIDKPIAGLVASNLEIAALPFKAMVTRTSGGLEVLDPDALSRLYGGAPKEGWVLTGVDHDYRIEQIWALGKAGRTTLFKNLAAAGVRCATAPNFSLIADVPRTDNLYSRKRIAIVWSELCSQGIPTALHLNARTAADFDFYARLLRETGASTVAFEFATGAAAGEAGSLFVRRLQRFAEAVGRPLHLIVRGGLPHYAGLALAFQRITQLDTAAHMKAKHRQVLERGAFGRGYKWKTQRTSKPVGELFLQAVEQCRWVDLKARQNPDKPATRIVVVSRANSVEASANDESPQFRLLP